jgi:NADPH-dependent glutamate synthase beta subunit-like oxidoreductase
MVAIDGCVIGHWRNVFIGVWAISSTLELVTKQDELMKSVAVADPLLTTREFLEGSEPVYIIGSGKTAMDCARQLIQHRRDRRREIHVIAGSGVCADVEVFNGAPRDQASAAARSRGP